MLLVPSFYCASGPQRRYPSLARPVSASCSSCRPVCAQQAGGPFPLSKQPTPQPLFSLFFFSSLSPVPLTRLTHLSSLSGSCSSGIPVAAEARADSNSIDLIDPLLLVHAHHRINSPLPLLVRFFAKLRSPVPVSPRPISPESAAPKLLSPSILSRL
jgi:hypothetical protein